MLHYRRRNSTEPAPARRMHRHPLLTYLNWSYDRSRHLDMQQLREILAQFDERYAHIYLRLFNEVPREIVSSFMREESIDERVLAELYHAMLRLGADLRPLE